MTLLEVSPRPRLARALQGLPADEPEFPPGTVGRHRRWQRGAHRDGITTSARDPRWTPRSCGSPPACPESLAACFQRESVRINSFDRTIPASYC